MKKGLIFGVLAACCRFAFPQLAAVPTTSSLHSTQPPSPTTTLDWLPAEFFPITTWDPRWPNLEPFNDKRSGLASLPQCGFNVAAFITPQHLPECQRLKIRGIISEPFLPPKWNGLTDEQILARVKKIIGNTATDPAVLGYYLEDEPGASEFPALGKAVAAVKQLAPGKLAYINLFPDYAIIGAKDISQLEAPTYEDYLRQYISVVKPQFVSYDNYQVQYSNNQEAASVAASYYRNLITVRRMSFEAGLPFWNIVASAQITAQFPPPGPADMQLQAYTTLAAGAQALTWYTYFSQGYKYTPVDTSGTRTATWSYTKMVNDQVATLGPVMRSLKSTGVYFTAPPPADGLPLLAGTIVKEATAPVPLMIGEFTGERDQPFAMVVNLSLSKTAQVTLGAHKPWARVEQVSPVDRSLQPLGTDGSLWLTPGQGALLRLTQ